MSAMGRMFRGVLADRLLLDGVGVGTRDCLDGGGLGGGGGGMAPMALRGLGPWDSSSLKNCISSRSSCCLLKDSVC